MITKIRHGLIKWLAGDDAVVLNTTFNMGAKDVFSSDPAKSPCLVEIPKWQGYMVSGCTFRSKA